MNHSSYAIDLPQDSSAVVFINGIKALNFRGFIWLWQLILSERNMGLTKVEGCIQAKLGICSHREAVIISYWQDRASLMNFFHSSSHRRMMKNTIDLISTDSQAIAVFNETYRPLHSGKYFNEPQGLAKIYPHSQPLTAKA